MKELVLLEIIKNTLSKRSHIGDDCAYLDDLNIVITQDSIVEDIHFSREFSTPFQIAYKAVMVNLSDVFASGAIPKYLTISLSLPKDIDNEFVSEFYRACDELSNEFDFEVVGGDITGADKIFISICAIGVTQDRKISSRSHAKAGDFVVTIGNHGSSAAGLFALQNNLGQYQNSINTHIMPTVNADFSNEIATKIERDYAMMDTSDGLADALYKIAQSSEVLVSVDFDKIPFDSEIQEIAKLAKVDYKEWVLYGGEDFKLIACLDEANLKKINSSYTIIGRVKEKVENHFVEVVFDDKVETIKDLEKTYNHFKEGK